MSSTPYLERSPAKECVIEEPVTLGWMENKFGFDVSLNEISSPSRVLNARVSEGEPEPVNIPFSIESGFIIWLCQALSDNTLVQNLTSCKDPLYLEKALPVIEPVYTVLKVGIGKDDLYPAVSSYEGKTIDVLPVNPNWVPSSPL